MNIYLVTEDSETSCVRAETMAEALSICEAIYLEGRKEEEGLHYNDEDEKDYYHQGILQSCTLVAELKN